ncbi:MAG: hypothetical protein IT380_15815 [Myxococcales bacterium]|nr:hypothetical protein [Myxococcales bacterium]
MTRTHFLLALAPLVVACAPSPTQLRIEGFLSVDSDCKPIDDDFSNGGTLDIAPGAPFFQLSLLITGNESFVQNEVVVGSHVLEPENRNRPILDRIVLSYKTSLGRLDPVQYARALHFDSGAAKTNVNLISPQVADRLMADVAPGDDVELQVSVEARGYMSGDRAAVTTGALVYPIRVIASDPANCMTGFQQPVVGECNYPGQSTHSVSKSLCCDNLVGAPGCP